MLPESHHAPQEEQHFYVHPDNWKAYRVFEACETQWTRLSGIVGAPRTGLYYPGVRLVMEAMGIKKWGAVFRQVQIIELGALSEINDQQDISDDPFNSR